MIVRPWYLFTRQECGSSAGIVVVINADPGQAFLLRYGVQLLQMWNHVNTWRTPRCPEFQKDRLAAQAAEREHLSVDSFELELWRRLAQHLRRNDVGTVAEQIRKLVHQLGIARRNKCRAVGRLRLVPFGQGLNNAGLHRQ